MNINKLWRFVVMEKYEKQLPYNLKYMPTKSQNLTDSCLVLLLSKPNPLKPGIKSRMNMQLEQRDTPTTYEWLTILLPVKVRLT